MLTESQRRRLAEFEGRCWHFVEGPFRDTDAYDRSVGCYYKCSKCGAIDPDLITYTDFNSVCPLLAKIVERGEWGSFRLWVKYEYDKVNWHGGVADCEAWMFANFTDPSHTAGLIAEWLERKEGA